MKRILIASVFVAVSSFLFADVKLTSGDLSALKTAGDYVYVEIDWSKAKVVELGNNNKVKKTIGTVTQYNKAQGDKAVKEWPEVKRFVENCTAWESYPMRSCFNSKNKKGALITVNPSVWKAYSKSTDEKEKKDMKNHCVWENPTTAKYKFVLTVDQVDVGSNVAVSVGMGKPSGGAVISGTISLVNIKTGKQVAQLAVTNCKGRGNFELRLRLMDTVVAEIFGEVAKLIK